MRSNDATRVGHRVREYHVDALFPNWGHVNASAPAAPGVYYLFDDEGYLLKIGSTGDLSDRIPTNFHEHSSNEPHLCPAIAVYDCCRTKDIAEHFERLLVENYESRTGSLPPLNKILPPQSDLLQRYIDRYVK